MEQIGAQDPLSPLISTGDSISTVLRQTSKRPSSLNLPRTGDALCDAGHLCDKWVVETVINFPSPTHSNNFSERSSRGSSPLRFSFLGSSDTSQQAFPCAGHCRQTTSSSFLSQCSLECQSRRHGSMQFLVAHGRSLDPGSDSGDANIPTEQPHVSAKLHSWGKIFLCHLGFPSTIWAASIDLTVGKTFLGGLIKPPVIRQFLHNGVLYKEQEERGLSRFELFADLVFVAIIRVCTSQFVSRDSSVK